MKLRKLKFRYTIFHQPSYTYENVAKRVRRLYVYGEREIYTHRNTFKTIRISKVLHMRKKDSLYKLIDIYIYITQNILIEKNSIDII